jgi:hypothetical protein
LETVLRVSEEHVRVDELGRVLFADETGSAEGFECF